MTFRNRKCIREISTHRLRLRRRSLVQLRRFPRARIEAAAEPVGLTTLEFVTWLATLPKTLLATDQVQAEQRPAEAVHFAAAVRAGVLQFLAAASAAAVRFGTAFPIRFRAAASAAP